MTDKKEKYLTPEIKVVELENENLLADSDPGGSGDAKGSIFNIDDSNLDDVMNVGKGEGL